jgi:hypothetical protein
MISSLFNKKYSIPSSSKLKDRLDGGKPFLDSKLSQEEIKLHFKLKELKVFTLIVFINVAFTALLGASSII